MNRNWPTDWQPNYIQFGAGECPLDRPETKAIAEFIMAHPNIAAGQSYHNAGGMILRGPGAAYLEGNYPAPTSPCTTGSASPARKCCRTIAT